MLVPSRLCWKWGSVLQVVKTLFKGHSPINAVSWVSVVHWMQMWCISFPGDLPSSLLAHLLLLFFGILPLVLGGLKEHSEEPYSSGFSDGWSPWAVFLLRPKAAFPYWHSKCITFGEWRLNLPRNECRCTSPILESYPTTIYIINLSIKFMKSF